MSALDQLRSEIQNLEKELKTKKAALKILQWTQSPTRTGPKKRFSAATRKKMSEARKKWHATHKKAK